MLGWLRFIGEVAVVVGQPIHMVGLAVVLELGERVIEGLVVRDLAGLWL